MSILQDVMRNSRELRARGLRSMDLLVLQSVARSAPHGWVRISQAAIARCCGVRRQTVHKSYRRLEALGFIVRLGPATMVNVKTMLKIGADAVKNRAEHLKRLYQKRKSACVTARVTHRLDIQKSGDNPAHGFECLGIMDRSAALRELRATYIPPWLRKSRI